MTGFLARLGERRPFAVIAVWLVAPGPVPFTDMIDDAKTAEFRLSDSAESVRADVLLAVRLLEIDWINEVVIVRSETTTVDSPVFRAKVKRYTARSSPWGVRP